MPSKNKAASLLEPITVVYTWHVNKGQDEAFKKWIHGIATAAMKFPGHLGVTTLRQQGSNNVYQSVVKFDNLQHLDAWLNSKERRKFVNRLEGIASEKIDKLTGLETWFETPGINPPPRWKMVIATFTGVYPTVLVLGHFVVPHLQHLNFFVRSLLFPIVLPIMLTYILMPFITQRLLKRWLYKNTAV